MYNRYIPQPDGTYRRNRMQDTHLPPPTHTNKIHEQEPELKPAQAQQRCRNQKTQKNRAIKQDELSAAGFLRRLLPKEFDTGDLMIVLLLLLMAGDCTEDRNTALLTLALYFFM